MYPVSFICKYSQIIGCYCILLILTGTADLRAGLCGHWDFDSLNSCGQVPDQAGNGHVGTFVGCASLSACGTGFNGLGRALCLPNDVGDWVVIANPTTFDVDTSHTWYAWIKSQCSDGVIMARNESQGWSRGSRSLFLRGCELHYDTAWGGFSDTCTDVTSCCWKQIVMTYDDTTDTLRFYQCGVHIAGQDDNSVNWNQWTEDSCHGDAGGFQAQNGFTIGQNDQPDPCNPFFQDQCTLMGQIDDVAVFNEILTDCEVFVSYDVGTDAVLKYDVGDFNGLKEAHDNQGTHTVGNRAYVYQSGLGCAAGVNLSGSTYTIVFNDAANTGVQMVTSLYWDTDITCGNSGATSCGSGNATGTWSNSHENWNGNSNGSGEKNATWACGLDAYFSASNDATGSYTVTVCGNMCVGAIYFEEGCVTLSGGTITLGDATPVLSVAACRTATIQSNLAGTNGITKTGSGTLVLDNGAKSVTGTITISDGRIDIDDSNTIVDSADVNLNGGTLELSNNVQETVDDVVLLVSSSMVFGTQADFTMDSFTMNAGQSLTITGWDNFTRYSTSQLDGTSFRVNNFPIGLDINNISVNGQTGFFRFIDGGDGYYYLTFMAPEPSTYLGGSAIILLIIVHFTRSHRRRRRG